MPKEIITATVLSEDNIATPETTEESTLDTDQNLDGDLDDLIANLDEGETDESSSGGFGLRFTSDKEYDLDAIIESISRDNEKYELRVRVNQESFLTLIVYYEIKQEILNEYNATSEEQILGYEQIFKSKLENFDTYFESLSDIRYAYYTDSETTRN
jgi:hypothetical protein